MKIIPFSAGHGRLFFWQAIPLAVVFVVGSRFFERFYYNGLQTIFSLYLVDILNFTQRSATLYFHIYCMLGSLFPLAAGLLGDSNLGKYRTIFYLIIAYIVGCAAIDVASTPFVEADERRLITFLGVLFISLGGGCASINLPFGGDQFSSSAPSHHLAHYFSVTYLCDNISILAALFITPILRHDYQCFDKDTCFPLAFTFLGFMLVLSLVVFMAGRSIYVRKKPERNIIADVTKCSCYALVKKFRSKEKKKHWLDYAEGKHSDTLISDTKAAFEVLFLFLPVPVFWALDDQMGSTWKFQAMHMDGSLGWFSIKPDQMQLLDPLLTLMLVPLFDLLLYPLLAKCHLLERPLERLTVGGLLAAASFVLASGLELKIQLPREGTAQLRVFNGLDCDVRFSNPLAPSDHVVRSLDALQILDVPQVGTTSYPVTFTTTDDCHLGANVSFSGTVALRERQSSSLFLHSPSNSPVVSQIPGFDKIDKNNMENPKLRVLYNLAPFVNEITLAQNHFSKKFILESNAFNTSLHSIPLTGKFTAGLGYSNISTDIELGSAGIYTLVVHSYNDTVAGRLFTVTSPNTVNMMWQLPQYIIMTVAEVMFAITGNELSYTQAPESMKSLISVVWTLMDAFGNLIVIAVHGQFFSNQAWEYLFFSGMMFVASLVFKYISMIYQYYDPERV